MEQYTMLINKFRRFSVGKMLLSLNLSSFTAIPIKSSAGFHVYI